jgi:hypothetical protein
VSVYETEALGMVRNWAKCLLDSSRGGVVSSRLCWGYGARGGREGEGEYEAFDAVEGCIAALGLERSRGYFRRVAVYGAGFMEGLGKTTEEQRGDWGALVRGLAEGIRAGEREARRV